MSTYYLWIRDVDRPTEVPMADPDRRPLFVFNLEAYARAPVDDWPREVVKVLEDAGLATFGTDCWVGSPASIPDGAGPFISVWDTGGSFTDRFQHGSDYERPTCQVAVRAAGYQVAEARAIATWRALKSITNTTIAAP